MTTIFDSAAPVKSDHPFARGIAPERRRPFIPSIEEMDEAAQMFRNLEDARRLEEENHRLEEQALEAAWSDQFNDTMPMTGHCLNCGDRCDVLTLQGLCDSCDTLATEDSIACVNELHGLGRREF
jgi:hypothetical protein